MQHKTFGLVYPFFVLQQEMYCIKNNIQKISIKYTQDEHSKWKRKSATKKLKRWSISSLLVSHIYSFMATDKVAILIVTAIKNCKNVQKNLIDIQK